MDEVFAGSPATHAAARSIEDVLLPIPRRRPIIDGSPVEPMSLPNLTSLKFKAGFFKTLARVVRWLSLIGSIVGGHLADRLTGRHDVARSAVRLRQGLQTAGGTFVKFGQQLAMRLDVLPWEYCVELAKLLDRMPEFPVQQALAAIERSAGRPWHEVFAVFDPKPVGSASMACVYQAVLKDGTKVAVKVRRPQIGELFATDFRVLDWFCNTIELLTIVRPGWTRGLRNGLKETLLEELDFRREAQYQDIFRRNAKEKSGKTFLGAPRVHFELSSDEVLVQEFVSGMWLWEVIAAVEQQDPSGLAMMKELDIDPKLVARRILWSVFWSMDENIFFHADPHPANMIIGRGSTVTFIDFGSCGSFDDEQLWALERMALSMMSGNAEGVARAGITLLEPLPRIDVTALMRDMEAEYMRVILIFRTKSEHTEWWERTSARQWLAMVKASRRYGLLMNVDMLRMTRATLLYDTLVLRLDRSIDRYQEYAKYRDNDRSRWARQRWKRRMRSARGSVFVRLEELGEAWEDLMDTAQQRISSPVLKFRSFVEKWVFTLTVLSKTVWRVLAITAAIIGAVAAQQYLSAGDVQITEAVRVTVQSRTYQAVIFLAVVLNTRHILFRLREREIKRRD